MNEEKDIDLLGELVYSRFDKARAAKQPHHADMVECLKLMNGEALSKRDPHSPDITMDIASPIVKNITGLIRDVFGSSAVTAPFTIQASPVAELPPDVENEMIAKVQEDLEMMVAMNGGDIDAVRKQITELRSVLIIEENRKAANAAEAMKTIISDRLHDAEWETEFNAFIENFVIYPAAIIKSPSVKEVRRLKWNGNTVAPTTEIVRQVENISPFDFYPAPYAQDVQSADYVIERRRMTRNDLLALRDAAGYAADTIDEVLEDAPNGSPLSYATDETDPATDTFGVDGADRDVYDALGYYGRIRNDTLAEYGIEFTEDELAGTSEAEVWVVGRRVIKCLLNPDPSGVRPFHKACFEQTPGAFWGKSPAMKLRDVQKVCTATMRSLVRNMQYSSGPIGEVEKGRIADGKDPTTIIPGTIRLVHDDNGMSNGAAAYRFYTVPSLASELTAIFDKFNNYAYELVGIPRLAFGSPQGLGTVGRTSGGISILANQSTKAIKQALRKLEKGVIEPVVQDFIHYELRTTTNEELRGDIRVYARGVSGLIESEQKNGDLEWGLQSISSMVGIQDPATGQPVVPVTAIQMLLYQLFKNKGLPTRGIFPDFDKQEALNDLIGGTQAGQPNEIMQTPQLDGRSPDAAGAIDNANGVL